jgi:hypothetical protein
MGTFSAAKRFVFFKVTSGGKITITKRKKEREKEKGKGKGKRMKKGNE